MTDLAALRGEVLGCLRGDSRFEGVTLTEEYPGTPRPLPADKRLITVGIERVELSPGGMGEAVCFSPGPLAEVTLRFDCWIPQKEPISCYLIDCLYDCLLGLGVTKLWSDPVKPEPGSLATRLRVLAALPVVLSKPDERQTIDKLILKRRENFA